MVFLHKDVPVYHWRRGLLYCKEFSFYARRKMDLLKRSNIQFIFFEGAGLQLDLICDSSREKGSSLAEMETKGFWADHLPEDLIDVRYRPSTAKLVFDAFLTEISRRKLM